MAAVHPGDANTYIPSHEASGKLVVDYSRNPSKFVINKYAQITPTDKTNGYYLKMTVEQAGRILNSDLRDFLWPDNAAASEHNDETESFEFINYRTKRLAFGFSIGDLTADQASWDIVAQHARIVAQRAMTARTQAAATVLETTGNYESGHNLDVTAISGNTGRWDQSTTARTDIKRTIMTAVDLILDKTLGAVDPDDLMLVMADKTAGYVAMSQEIHDYIKGSPEALAQIRGELPNDNTIYGLPAKLYGVPVMVEKTRKVTSFKGAATTTRAKVLTPGAVYLLSRVGGLEGVEGAPSFSSLTLFMQEEMTVETLNDINNRRKKGRVVENYSAVMTAPSASVRLHTATPAT